MIDYEKTYQQQKWTIGWGISSKCDLDCKFCYSKKFRDEFKNDTNLNQAEIFLNRNKEKIKSINFGTGEFFLSSHYLKILKMCKEIIPKSTIAVTTNGSISELPGSILKKINTYINECDISLDFSSQEDQDYIRGKKGVWQRAVSALEKLKDTDLKVSIVMVGTNQTLTENNIEGLFRISEKFKAALRINIFMPSSGDFSFIPSKESVYFLINKLLSWSPNLITSDPLFRFVIYGNKIKNYKNTGFSCRILPNGDVSPSTYLLESPWILESSGDGINLDSLLTKKEFIKYYNPDISDICRNCINFQDCKGGSVERRWLWNKDLKTPDPLCPFRENEKEHFFINKKPDVIKWEGPFVHLNYLPTIVALPPNYS